MENFIFCAVSMIEIKMKISNKDIKFIFQEIRCKHDMKITIIGSPKLFFFWLFFSSSRKIHISQGIRVRGGNINY